MDNERVIDHLKIIHTWAAVGKKPIYRGIEPKCCENVERWVMDAIDLLKEQETEIRQLKLALDIAKGTCKGIKMGGR